MATYRAEVFTATPHGTRLLALLRAANGCGRDEIQASGKRGTLAAFCATPMDGRTAATIISS